MNVLIIGGFLGSGKTAVVNKLLREMDARGLRVAVIENEIGTSGVDQAAMDQVAVRVTPMFGGCVCCQLAGEFRIALSTLRREVDPDWVVVELSGLALMKDMQKTLRPLVQQGLTVHTAAIADASRFLRLQKACALILGNQMQNVDLILLNKIDLQPVTDEILAAVRSINDEAPILPVSAIGEAPIWENMQKMWRDCHGEPSLRP